MKKLIGLFVAAMMLFSVMTANAKVTYEEKDGKWTCIITYKNDNMAAVNCIGTMTGNWKVPGEPMVKNAQGEWEYRFVMERAKEFYKFYDPALEGDIAYFALFAIQIQALDFVVFFIVTIEQKLGIAGCYLR